MLLLKRKTFDVEVDRPLVTADEAGVLAQAEDVIAAYRAIDPSVPLAVWRQEGDWVCIAGTRA